MERAQQFAPMCFHPLKAGRRPRVSATPLLIGLGFHPLKAGRRQFAELRKRSGRVVSIPSRRVGDPLVIVLNIVTITVSIPSRRVGDSTSRRRLQVFRVVSIPSRRVGD